MVEIGVESCAQGILPVSIRSDGEPVFRAFTPAGKIETAAQAFCRQGVALGKSELQATAA